MTQLVYGVLRGGEEAPDSLPLGLDGLPVNLAAEGGLAAAVSETVADPTPPSVERALAYARVVEALHQRYTVLPMRYGCLLRDKAAVGELLRARQAVFLAALDEVEGCDEMGLRVLPGDERPPLAPRGRGEDEGVARTSTGLAYLAGRRAGYAAKDSRQQQADEAAEHYRRAFNGLYRRCEAEQCATTAGPLASLYFLVPRADGGRFRNVFLRAREKLPGPALLTGPWPPYNFAASSRTGLFP